MKRNIIEMETKDVLSECGFDEWEYVQSAHRKLRWSKPYVFDVAYADNVFTAKETITDHVPNQQAIEEFEGLLVLWRSRGWNDLADVLATDMDYELGESTPMVEHLTQPVERVENIRIENPVFYKAIPYVNEVR